jgi:hypothetical protein
LIIIFTPISIGVILWLVVLAVTQPWTPRPIFTPWIIAITVLAVVVTWESVISNVARLNDRPVTPIVYYLAVVASLLTGGNVWWILGGVAARDDSAETLPWALIALGIATSVQLSTLICIGVASNRIVTGRRTPYTSWFNLFQDGILFVALAWVFVCMPLFVYRHLSISSFWRFVETALTFGPVLSFTGAVLLMTLKNNYDHLARKTAQAAAAGHAYVGMPIPALTSHIRFQNRAAIIYPLTTVVGTWEGVKDLKALMSLLFH